MLNSKRKKPRLLLHVCCAVCAVYVSKFLENDYSLELFFYNPNIYPYKEWEIRLKEAKRLAKEYKLNLLIPQYNHDKWLKAVEGHEKDREGGERCAICYYYRLEKTAQKARAGSFNYFSTTLTVSPHKVAEKINKIGNELSKEFNIRFLEENFKKQDGFKKTMELAKQLELYRQNYCGCEFSMR